MDKIQGLRNYFDTRTFEWLDKDNFNHIERLFAEMVINQLEEMGDNEILAINEDDIKEIVNKILNDNEIWSKLDNLIIDEINARTQDFFENNFNTSM